MSIRDGNLEASFFPQLENNSTSNKGPYKVSGYLVQGTSTLHLSLSGGAIFLPANATDFQSVTGLQKGHQNMWGNPQ
jgi:hypothetical protein